MASREISHLETDSISTTSRLEQQTNYVTEDNLRLLCALFKVKPV